MCYYLIDKLTQIEYLKCGQNAKPSRSFRIEKKIKILINVRYFMKSKNRHIL